ncbi:ABC transporter outer membrane protein [Alcanivorax sp. 521-1]|uniref:ABC transporter outer membrane protein n=1 Tax=Alloalcanivorax profundimaris TaxID=2735259 RepID=A0ABS0ASB2_9GAMM|nr:efflux transporter outer membrane subunit [Alloalcanivorax profundimaris]MBF5057028.1 ABC transporter outer membrane protein [Alloalcanivorax profundimaris]
MNNGPINNGCKRVLTMLTLALTVAGCAVRSGLETPEPEAPAQWENQLADSRAALANPAWWQGFGSDELNQLVARALTDNTDLQAAAARVLQAEGRLQQAGSSLFPSLSLGGGASTSGTFGGNDGTDRFQLNANASYELDLWGRLRNNKAIAEANLDASRFDRDAVRLTVLSSVASTWLQWRYLQDRLTLAENSLALAERILEVVEAKVRYGAVSPQDLAQQRTLVANQRAALPDLRQQTRETRYALAVLVGETPQGFLPGAGDGGLADLTVPEIQPGLPADVLAQRPDVGRALAGLMAADYGVAVARTAYWPSLSLTGSAGYASSSLGDLFDGDAVYNLAASLSQLIFDGGQTRGENTVARAAWLEQVAGYRGVLLTALSEVDQGLGNINALDEQGVHRREALTQARRGFEIAETRYREGDIELTSVLDAQTSLISARQNLLDLRYDQLVARVTLYRVLGQGLAGPL